jgi:PhzF family phenazine biosynthesis protein
LTKRFRFYQVDAFTTERFAGNAAGVVPEAHGLTDVHMQAIARELNNSETAFILPPDASDHELRIRFFTPTVEVPSCGHATIAAHYVRAVENQLEPCTVMHKIGAGVLPVVIDRLDGDYRVVMTQDTPTFDEPIEPALAGDVLAAMGLEWADVDERCPMQVVSTGHAKVLIGIRSLSRLHELKPDLAELSAMSARVGSNGYYVFVLRHGEPYAAHGRMFAPAIGIAEDPATGNANGPLGAYLVKHRLMEPVDGVLRFRARQGEAMGRPGDIDVTVECEGRTPFVVHVAGRAVIVFRSEMRV